jgi:AraC-like DNA-binding protein
MHEQKLFSGARVSAPASASSYTVAASYLSALADAGESLGINKQLALSTIGLSCEELNTHSNRIALIKFLQLADYLQQQTGRQDIGLVMAQLAKPSTFSALGYAAMSCSTLFEAATLIPRYEDVVVNAGKTDLAVKNGLGSICWQAKEAWINHPVLQDMVVAGWYCFAKWATADTQHYPVKVRLAHPKPCDESNFRKLFNSPIEFGSEINEILFDASYLQEPINHSDEEFNQLMRQRADKLMKGLISEGSVSQKVVEILQKILPKHEASITSVALSLNISERTLRRRLSEEDNSFQKILIKLRQELAHFYLSHTELSMLDVALLLGYSDQSTFTSAFKSWFQQTPSEWKSQFKDE